MTETTARHVRVFILPGTGAATGVRDTASCLRNHPEVEVTLVAARDAPPESLGKGFKRQLEKRLGSRVETVGGEGESLRIDAVDGDGSDVYIFIPAGDWLNEGALDAIAARIRDRGADVVYVDQDRIDDRNHLTDPQFKPGPNYEYLVEFDYTGNLLCVRRSILARYGGIDAYDYPASRYALLLRAFSGGRTIEHIAAPLYHSRSRAGSPGMARVLRAHFRNENPPVEVIPGANDTCRIRRSVRGKPRTTIVIPFRDRPRLLKNCVDAVLQNTRNSEYDVLGVSNRSRSSETYRLMRELSRRDERIRFVEHNIPFNFSALVNHGVGLASGDFIVLMNNDITVENEEWLDAMLEHGQRIDVGVVGAKLLYPDGTIQHAGLSVQGSGHIGHMHKNHPGDSTGYMNRLVCVQSVSAVTAALCLFSRALHRELGGFDERQFGVAYNDVDFCLRAEALGRRNVFTPHALARHHESLSRGYENTQSKRARFQRERSLFWERYRSRLGSADPNYGPNFDQHRDDFSY